MAIAFVRNCPAVGAVGNIALVTPAAGHAAGNTLVVPVVYLAGTGPTGITDAKGNAYTKKKSQSNGAAVTVEIWSSLLGSSLVSADAITIAGSGTGRATADEFSGLLDVVDVTAGTTAAAGSTLGSCPLAAPSNANDLIYGAVGISVADFLDLVSTGYTASTAGWLTPAQILRNEWLIQAAKTARNLNTGGPQWSVQTGVQALIQVAISHSVLPPGAVEAFPSKGHPGPRYQTSSRRWGF